MQLPSKARRIPLKEYKESVMSQALVGAGNQKILGWWVDQQDSAHLLIAISLALLSFLISMCV